MNRAAGRILVGDARQHIATLAAASVDMVLTSPPYFRLRNYATDGQLGLEDHVDHWVKELHLGARDLRGVLKPSGSLWLNLGDSYATHPREGAPRKSLLLGPERVAAALLADGWLLRNKIVWQKANPMPSSVRDRFTGSWEYLYLFARSSRYYFDLDPLRQPHQSAAPSARRPPAALEVETWRGPNSNQPTGLSRMHERGQVGHPLGKNPGDVWRIASSNYRGAHHATFPLELARRAIQAGCPPGGLVLDPFMGAGTTAVAAEQLGRRWLGIELNPDFARQANNRIQAARAGPLRAAA